MSTGRPTRKGSFVRTVEHRADESSGKIGFLLKVHRVCNPRRVGIVGPRLGPGVRHVQVRTGGKVSASGEGFLRRREGHRLEVMYKISSKVNRMAASHIRKPSSPA